jgi:hypothetical protein
MFFKGRLMLFGLVSSLVPFSHQGLEMRMPAGIITERLNCSDDSWYACLFPKRDFEKLRQALRSTLTEPAQQLTVVEKKFAQDLRN